MLATAARAARTLMPKVRRATLADNRAPDRGQLDRGLELGRMIVRSVEQRETIIAAEGLDRTFALPDANWHADGPNDYLAAYRLLSSLDWDEIKYLRLRAQCFSGFSLLHLRDGAGTCSTDPIPADFDERIPQRPPNTMLWRRRLLIYGLPSSLIYRPPPMLGEVGWWINGALVNADTITYQERLSLLHSGGILAQLPPRPRILEIGGGYGALASGLLSALPGCEYWICDLPESLLFSCLYLSLTREEPIAAHTDAIGSTAPINLLPNYRFPLLVESGAVFDLVINTLSLSEMSPHQIQCYVRGCARMISEGVFFEQNRDNRHIGLSFTKPIVTKHFAKCKPVRSIRPIRNGRANVWGHAAARRGSIAAS